MTSSHLLASPYHGGVTEEATFTIDKRALAKLSEIRKSQPDGEQLGLVVSITGIDGERFTYEMAMMLPAHAAPDDVIINGEVPVVVPAGDFDKLRGATLTMSRDLLNPGFTIDNPNSPSPAILGDATAVDLSGDVAQRVTQVLQEVINPAIASHGGSVSVAAVEPPTLYIRFAGGCQGCGMATVTLSQGIESTIRSLIPEITSVMDVTNHAEGNNPYYEKAKK